MMSETPAEQAVPETPAEAPAPVSTATSNVSPALPPGAQAAAARAHHALGHVLDLVTGGRTEEAAALVQKVQADIERFVPAGYIQAAESEARALLRSVL